MTQKINTDITTSDYIPYKVKATECFVDSWDEILNPKGYARELRRDKALSKILANFSFDKFAPVILSDRSHRDPSKEGLGPLTPFAAHKRNRKTSDSYALIDGQRRIYAAQQIHGIDVEVECVIRTGLTQEQEAGLYNAFNSDNTQLTPCEKYRGYVAEGVQEYVEVENMLQEIGIRVGTDLNAIRGVMTIYERSPYVTNKTLRVLKTAWNKEPMQFSACSISSVFHLLMATNLDVERLIRRMQAKKPLDLYHIVKTQKSWGKQNMTQQGNNTLGANVLVDWYNVNLSESNRLGTVNTLHRYSERNRMGSQATVDHGNSYGDHHMK